MTSYPNQVSNLEQVIRLRRRSRSGIIFIGLTPDGQTLIVGDWTKIQLWDLPTKQKSTLICNSHIFTIAMSANGLVLVCGDFKGIIKGWNLQTRKQTFTFRGHRTPIKALALSRNGTIIASSANDSTLRFWDQKKGRELGLFNETEIEIDGLVLSAYGKIAVYRIPNSVRMFHWKTYNEISLLEVDDSESVTIIAASPDRHILSISHNETIKVWNFLTREEIQTLIGHSDIVSSVTISANGHTLVSSDLARTIKIWDLATGQEVFTFEVEDLSEGAAEITKTYVTTSADGRTLAYCGDAYWGADSGCALIKIWKLS